MVNHPTKPLGINLIGHLSGGLGLGVAARNTLRMLLRLEQDVALADIDPGYGRAGRDDEFASLLQAAPRAPFGVNLFQLNPPEVLNLVRWPPDWLDISSANALVPFWELPLLPVRGSWREVLTAVDLVLAPTAFVADAVRASSPQARVAHYRQTVYLPDGIDADRRHLGLPVDSYLFLTALDPNSDANRKNTLGALEAFSRAFGDSPKHKLVVKLSGRSPVFRSRLYEHLRRKLAETPGVILLDEYLDYRRALGAVAACDAFVSLHRSEGLGLHVLEAMALGKPCVVTAWSGTMDFTTDGNACLVPFTLVPVHSEHPAYQERLIGSGQVWAEPSLAAAAEWMRTLAADPQFGSAVGAKAAATIEQSRRDFEAGTMVEMLRETCSSGSSPASRGRREEAWEQLRRVPVSTRIRRSAGSIARRLGLRP